MGFSFSVYLSFNMIVAMGRFLKTGMQTIGLGALSVWLR
tara:strand:+ start:222 stop:338 length:117 start_codon:yes stop_codon:yes gene_type:complete